MDVALITTTINVPTVLALYRPLGTNVRFFVALDSNTPPDANEYLNGVANCVWFSYPCDWACSELIGWNTDSRRNIALLEAVKWGADVIISIDDDMIPLPLDGNFFDQIRHHFSQPFSGLRLGFPRAWCDAGQFTIPPARQRGLPLDCHVNNAISFVVDAQIGAMQGTILGVPDTDAATMFVDRPIVHSATDILRSGIVAHPKACAVFNSQFTAFRRELAPCFAQFYKWQKRNTDIFASLIMRRVMREKNLYTYFGPPTGYHARTPRNPIKDMAAEAWGLEHVAEFAFFLDELEFGQDATVLEMTRSIVRCSHVCLSWWAPDLTKAMNAFLDDVEKVL